MAYPIIIVENTEIEDKDIKDQETNKLRAALGLPPMKTKSPTKSPKIDGKSPNVVEKQYKCADCEYTTPNVTVLANHMKEIHEKSSEKDDENSQIINANVSFEGKTLLEIPVKTNKLDLKGKDLVKQFKCSLCDAEYTLKGNLKKHIKLIHDGERFECTICENVSFTQKHTLTKHVESVHERKLPFQEENKIPVHEGKKLFSCTVCNFGFQKQSALIRHVEAVHEKKKDYECSVCEHRFSNINQLKTHIEIVHEGKKPFKCSKCDRRFTHRGKLKIHIANIHNGIGEILENTENLEEQAHESVHDENKPFKCVQCPSRFARLCGLNRHFEAVHEKKRPFECTHCERCFYEKNKLKKHMESVHDVSLETIDKQRCFVCDKVFESKKSLDNHISSAHEGIISQFIQKENYGKIVEDTEMLSSRFTKEHSPEVHEEKMPFECKECQAGFEEKSHLTGQ